MDAEGTPAIAEDASQNEEAAADEVLPARRLGSAAHRLQATMAAADRAAEEILEAARGEARELIERAEQVANSRTAELHTQAELLLTRANDLTQQAQALGAATRELTSSVHRVISVEAPAVTELELPAGEDAAGLLESTTAEGAEAEADAMLAEIGALAEAPATAPAEQEASPAEQAEEDTSSAEEEEASSEEPESRPEVTAEDDAEPATEDDAEPATEIEPEAPSDTPPEPAPEAQPTPEAESPAEQEDATEQETDQEAAAAQAPAAEQPPSRKRRSLFGRLSRRDHETEGVAQARSSTSRPRASEDAIAEVSPGHQMLARQMLLDGIVEAEVERRLRDEFRVRDPGAVLDSLQPSTPPISPTKAEGTNERKP